MGKRTGESSAEQIKRTFRCRRLSCDKDLRKMGTSLTAYLGLVPTIINAFSFILFQVDTSLIAYLNKASKTSFCWVEILLTCLSNHFPPCVK